MSGYFASVSLMWNVVKPLHEEDLEEEFEEDPREYTIRIYAYEEGMPVKVTWQRIGWKTFAVKEVGFDYCIVYVSSPPVDFDFMVRFTQELLRKLWLKFGIVYRIGGYEALNRKDIEEYVSQFVEWSKRRCTNDPC